MRRLQQEKREQDSQAVYLSQTVRRTRKRDAPIPDIEMESVKSRQDRSDTYYPEGGDPDDSGQDDLRRTPVVAMETAPGGGLSAPRIRMSAIADLKEFNEKDRDEDRARSWISKVKFAFIRDQAPDEEKCLVFGISIHEPQRLGITS